MARFKFAGVKSSKKKAARNPSAASYEIERRKVLRKASAGRKASKGRRLGGSRGSR
jgi:hypothetical protein